MAIIDILKKNPYISQQEMAHVLQMSRPAVANMLSNLTKRGIIRGRAYILAEDEVICIGGANVDRKFLLGDYAQLETSNPASVHASVGGVARNIGENLGRLGECVRLISIAGADADWKFIEQESSAYIDLSTVELQPNVATGSYSAVLNPDGELVIAMANMDVYNLLTPEYVEQYKSVLANGRLIVVDLNCPIETVQHVKDWAVQHQKPLAIIPVSVPKMNRMPDDLLGVTWLICNIDEAESYLNYAIDSDEKWQSAVEQFCQLGVENVAITAGKKGIMVAGKGHPAKHYKPIPNVKIEDVTGAGDAFVSGVLYGHLTGAPVATSIHYGRVNAAKTLEATKTVRTTLTAQRLVEEMEELV